MTEAEPNVKPGEILAGKYRVERVLGAGGMGFVVAALHLQLNERVAIKLLLPEIAQSREALARFTREAQSAVRIKSEHVARVSDVGQLPNGAPYMVMEYLDGTDLAQLLETRGPLPVAEALAYVLQACEALAEAHTLGIVHRDLKPSNLFLTRRADGSPLVKVLDFGISKATADATGHAATDFKLTATGAVLGSPQYMSPEQVRDARTVDHRTDIWALGLILYELLVARTAFQATTLPGLLARIVTDPPEPIRIARPDVPASLEATILRCLEKDPARRPANVAVLAKELLPYAPPASRLSVERVISISMPAPVPSSFDATIAAATAKGAMTGGSWGGTHHAAKKRRGGAFGLAAAAIVVVGAVGVTGWMWKKHPGARRVHATATASAVPSETVASASVEPPPAVSAVPAASASAEPSASVATKPSATPRPPRSGKHGAPQDLGSAIDSRH